MPIPRFLAGPLRIRQSEQPLTERWQEVPIAPRHATLLGISFRPLQADALGLDAHTTLDRLLAYPFQMIRLGAYWNRIEPTPGVFQPAELDWQIDAAERAGKQIIVCVGPVKTFGYPECFVPAHHLHPPLREHSRITPSSHQSLLTAATDFLARLVDRYRARHGIVAWQLEHEAVDPLGFEHSWRLDAEFVKNELAALRHADPTRPIVLNGYLPTSLPNVLSLRWMARDQGDSLALAQRLADIVGIDYYPRNALVAVGKRTVYLDGSASPWQHKGLANMFAWARQTGKQVMVTEGQAEPWEAVTTPPNPGGRAMYSCLPEHLLTNYNACMQWSQPDAPLYAYLFWGAEYWVLRHRSGDPSYLQAFAQILEQAGG
jgi:hypothetical protein